MASFMRAGIVRGPPGTSQGTAPSQAWGGPQGSASSQAWGGPQGSAPSQAWGGPQGSASSQAWGGPQGSASSQVCNVPREAASPQAPGSWLSRNTGGGHFGNAIQPSWLAPERESKGDPPTNDHSSFPEGESPTDANAGEGATRFERASGNDPDEEEDAAVQIFFLKDGPLWPVPGRHTQGSPLSCTLAHSPSHSPPQTPPSVPHTDPHSDSTEPYSDSTEPYSDSTEPQRDTARQGGNASLRLPQAGLSAPSHDATARIPWEWVGGHVYESDRTAGASKQRVEVSRCRGPGDVPKSSRLREVSECAEPMEVTEWGSPVILWGSTEDAVCAREPGARQQWVPCEGEPQEGSATIGEASQGKGSSDNARRVPSTTGNDGSAVCLDNAPRTVPVRRRHTGGGALGVRALRKMSLEVITEGRQASLSAFPSPSPERPTTLSDSGTASDSGVHPGYNAQRAHSSARMYTMPSFPRGRHRYATQGTRATAYTHTAPRSTSLPTHPTFDGNRCEDDDSDCAFGAFGPIHCNPDTPLDAPGGAGPRMGRRGGLGGAEARVLRAFEGAPLEKGHGEEEGVLWEMSYGKEGVAPLGKSPWGPRGEGALLANSHRAEGALLANSLGLGMQGLCSSEPAIRMDASSGHKSSGCYSSVLGSGAYSDTASSRSGEGEEGQSDTSDIELRGTHYGSPYLPSPAPKARGLKALKTDSSAPADSEVVEALVRLACHDFSDDISSSNPTTSLSTAAIRHHSLTSEPRRQLATSAAGRSCSTGSPTSAGRRVLTSVGPGDAGGAPGAYPSPPFLPSPPVSKSHSCDVTALPSLSRALVCPRPILVSPDRRAGVHRGQAGPERAPLSRRVSFDKRVAVITYR